MLGSGPPEMPEVAGTAVTLSAPPVSWSHAPRQNRSRPPAIAAQILVFDIVVPSAIPGPPPWRSRCGIDVGRHPSPRPIGARPRGLALLAM